MQEEPTTPQKTVIHRPIKPSISIPANEILATFEVTPTSSSMDQDTDVEGRSGTTTQRMVPLKSPSNKGDSEENNFIADIANILQCSHLVEEATASYKILQSCLMDIDLVSLIV